ncbi:MAG: hypothetical protein WCK77_13090 [Verrucomicrobiota bacterium]
MPSAKFFRLRLGSEAKPRPGKISLKDLKLVRSTALGATSGKQPAEALKLMNEADIDPSYRQNIISNIFVNPGGQPENAESLLDLLGSDRALVGDAIRYLVAEPVVPA